MNKAEEKLLRDRLRELKDTYAKLQDTLQNSYGKTRVELIAREASLKAEIAALETQIGVPAIAPARR